MVRHLPYGPKGFQMATAGFAGCLALSLLLSASPMLEEDTIYRTLLVFPISQTIWGIFMGLYAGLGVVCLFWGQAAKQAAWSAISILVWTFWGSQAIYGGLMNGYVPTIGLFGATLAAGNFMALLQIAGGKDAVD